MTTKNVGREQEGTTRRQFLKSSTATAVGVAAFTTFFTVKDAEAITTGENTPDPVSAGSGQSVVYRFSNCQNCHSRCGLMGKIMGPTGSTSAADGVLVKLEGNPYHPNNMEEDERLAFATAPAAAQTTPGRLCPKGHAGLQVLYNPFRIKRPLKRVGARGSGKWQVISWSTALTEISTKMETLIPRATRLTTPIDAANLRLGPIANQLCFAPGRSEDKQIVERIFKNTFGTANYRLDHTSICETTHHVVDELMTWENGKKHHFKPDIMNSEYIIIFGGNWNEANFPMLALSRKLAEFKKRAGTKVVVVDPRFSNTAAKADVWLPAIPGTDGAVALGMAYKILDDCIPFVAGGGSSAVQNTITYLRNPNATQATADLQKTYSDAAWLVVVGKSAGTGPAVGTFLKGGDVAAIGGASPSNCFYQGAAVREVDNDNLDGDLLPGLLTIPGTAGEDIYCKTVFELTKNSVYDNKSVAYYAGLAGIDEGTLTQIATEFHAKGNKAVVNPYRGTVQHTNGYQAMKACQLLNTLVGNYDWKGGNQLGGSKYSFDAGMKGSGDSGGAVQYDPAGLNITAFPYGPRIDRAKAYALEEPVGTDDFNAWYQAAYGFTAATLPATRPWGPYWTHGNYQEAFLGIATGYPYACKVLITYWNAWPYSTPGLKDVYVSAASDESKIPLHVAISTTMGETEVYADYILPETTYLEKWCFPGTTPTIIQKFTNFRQPLVGAFDGKAWNAAFDPTATNNYSPVYPETRTMDDILIQLMAAYGLTTDISTAALPSNHWGESTTGLTNLKNNYNAAEGTAYTESDIAARGGAFSAPGSGYSGNYVTKTYGKLIHLYLEQMATTIDTMKSDTAANFNPATNAAVIAGAAADLLSNVVANRLGNPVVAWEGMVIDIKDNAVEDLTYPFWLLTFKTVLHGQARTIDLPWLTGIQPENFVWINSSDAASMGIRTYDKIRLTSPTGSEVGRALVTEGIRPGVVATAHHFGHWEHSSRPHSEDGTNQSYDASRKAGIQTNPIMRLDPVLGDVTLQEKIGGSCSFSDTRVKVEKL
ncbi:MAG: molybdopterin-dependent oxidoreductase [Planctomycetota bacterium]|jgi:anaerobic selenocysteine-containing dehydrogenase